MTTTDRELLQRDYRQQWKERGELFDCPNPSHFFKIGRLAVQWRWAADCWSTLTVNGYMHNHALSVCTVNTLGGARTYKVIIWKLSVMFGLIPAAAMAGEGE